MSEDVNFKVASLAGAHASDNRLDQQFGGLPDLVTVDLTPVLPSYRRRYDDFVAAMVYGNSGVEPASEFLHDFKPMPRGGHP